MPTRRSPVGQPPESTKARILAGAQQAFARYGFHGATTRVIAAQAGVDISTLHYHWGDKGALYQAVIAAVSQELRGELARVEKIIRGRPLAQRMEIALDEMTGFLFDHPQIANLILHRYFGHTREEMHWDQEVPGFAHDIARSMGLAQADGSVGKPALMRVITMMTALYNLVSGESFFRSMLDMERGDYLDQVRETLKFLLIPAFTGRPWPGEGSASVHTATQQSQGG